MGKLSKTITKITTKFATTSVSTKYQGYYKQVFTALKNGVCGQVAIANFGYATGIVVKLSQAYIEDFPSLPHHNHTYKLLQEFRKENAHDIVALTELEGALLNLFYRFTEESNTTSTDKVSRDRKVQARENAHYYLSKAQEVRKQIFDTFGHPDGKLTKELEYYMRYMD